MSGKAFLFFLWVCTITVQLAALLIFALFQLVEVFTPSPVEAALALLIWAVYVLGGYVYFFKMR